MSDVSTVDGARGIDGTTADGEQPMDPNTLAGSKRVQPTDYDYDYEVVTSVDENGNPVASRGTSVPPSFLSTSHASFVARNEPRVSAMPLRDKGTGAVFGQTTAS
jgi:hypothetical protein